MTGRNLKAQDLTVDAAAGRTQGCGAVVAAIQKALAVSKKQIPDTI